MICAKCGRDNPPEYQFCVHCGASMLKRQPEPTYSLDGSNAFSPQFTGGRADSFSGRTLDNKYRLETKLGSGGMGAVYLTTRLHIGDKVAVKVLHGDMHNDPQAVERFRLEAQTAARLKHPNAVAVYDYGVTEDGLRYLVMELVEGHTLRQIISQQGALPLPAVTEVVSQVCAALEEAHRQGIVHRDIKPDNIIVQETHAGLRVKVLDFGIAKLRELSASNLTKGGSVMGTPRYMSPEHCMGEELDGRSDIYSLGIVLYEMLCGIVPFTAPTSTAVAVQQVTQAPPPLRRINSFVPPAVEAVVMHALEKKREARPQTAMALAQELNAAVHGRQLVQPSLTRPTAGAVVTNQNAPVSTSDAYPTIATIASPSGSREIIPPNFLQNSAGVATSGGSNKKRLLLILGAMILLAGAGVGAFMLLSRNSQSETVSRTDSVTQPSNKPSTDNSNRQGTPVTTPSPAVDSANEELNRLRARRAGAPPEQLHEVAHELEEAADKYPTDYRFPYERAKLLTRPGQNRHESFPVLFEAGRKAIRSGQAERMLSDLRQDQGGDFRPLTDHREWTVLESALQRGDEADLSASGHHH